MRSIHSPGTRTPVVALVASLLFVMLVPLSTMAAEWTTQGRVSSVRGSRLDSLHQLSSGRGWLHVVHARVGSQKTDDRVVYQRSNDTGRDWSREKSLFSSTNKWRHLAPNLAIASRGPVVVAAWRVTGPDGTTLFARTSADSGRTFDERVAIFSTSHASGIGVPAVAVGNDVVAVAWTNRANGKIKIRTSRNGGKTFKSAKTLARTKLSIDCRRRVTDGLVGLVAADKRMHVAWSHANSRSCQAGSIKMRSSTDRGKSFARVRLVTGKRSYGWPELAVRGRTVAATVQSPSGALIVASSSENGRKWQDRLIKPQKGHSFSAADIVLLPGGKAEIAYVDERLKNARLISTRLLSRRSPNDGRSFKPAKVIMPSAKRLRMAPNLAANASKPTVVYQSGAMDHTPRNLYSARLQ
jgi:hypothetical protein